MINSKLTCQPLKRNDLTGQADTHGQTQTFYFKLAGPDEISTPVGRPQNSISHYAISEKLTHMVSGAKRLRAFPRASSPARGKKISFLRALSVSSEAGGPFFYFHHGGTEGTESSFIALRAGNKILSEIVLLQKNLHPL